MDKIPDRIDSKFRFVLLASHRAEQIMRGAQPRIALKGALAGAKTVRVAMEEITQDLIEWDYGPEPRVIPTLMEGDESEEEALHAGEASHAAILV